MKNNLLSTHVYCYISVADIHISTAHLQTIVQEARTFNQDNQISGILFYDGAHFAQYIEGHAQPLLQAVERIKASRSHDAIEVLYAAHKPASGKFDKWSMGYLDCINSRLDINRLREKKGSHEGLLEVLHCISQQAFII